MYLIIYRLSPHCDLVPLVGRT